MTILQVKEISKSALDGLVEAIETATSEAGDGSVRTISAEVLRETGQRYPECECENLPLMERLFPHVKGHLYAGMPVKDLGALGMGCTTRIYDPTESASRWTPVTLKERKIGMGSAGCCMRLDHLRRRYDK